MKTSTKKNRNACLYVFGSIYPYVTGGMEIFNYYFLNHCLNKNDRVTYYYTSQRTASVNGYFIPQRNIWPVRIFYPFQFFYLIWQLKEKIDFAYISYAQQSWIISFSQSFILWLFRIPYIITIHSGKEPEWNFAAPFKFYFRHAEYVVGVSEPICAAFKKAIPEQTYHYIPPLVPFEKSMKPKDEIKTMLGFQKEDRVLLYVGSLKGMKNPDKIVTAFGKLDSSFLIQHKIKMVFVGMGEMENELNELIMTNRLNDYIRIAGWVSRENIPDYYQMADAYIISSDYEGTSLSLLEAMFNELAIIGSNAPGINRMLIHENNALLYDTNNTDELAAEIMRLFSDDLLRNKISMQAYSDFKIKYSFELMMGKYEEIFASVSH